MSSNWLCLARPRNGTRVCTGLLSICLLENTHNLGIKFREFEFQHRPVRMEVAVEIKGSNVHMDWTGTDPQTKGGVNLPMSSTFGVGIYALKAALGPDIIPNAGLWRPLTVSAPKGSFVNPVPPAPSVE